MKESPLDQEEDNTASKKGQKESLGEEHGSWGRELANRRVTFGTAIREGRGVSRYPLFLSLPFAVCLPLIFFFLFSFRFASFFSSSLFPFPPFFFRFILLLCTWAAGDTCIDDFHLILLFRCVVQAFSFLRLVSLWFFFLLPTPARPQCPYSCHRHHLPLSRGSYAPVGPLPVVLRALSPSFFFVSFLSFLFAPPQNLRPRHTAAAPVAVSYC